MYKAIFVDIDNTILDFEAYVYESLKSGFAKFGLGAFEPWMIEVFHRENDALWRALERKELTLDELMAVRFNKVFAALGVEFDGVKFETYFREALWDSAILVEGARELLEGLAEKYVVCAASNGPFEQQVHRLEICGLLGLFDHLFISQDIGVNKPAKEFFEEAFRRLNEGRGDDVIVPQECVMIGDSMTSDMAGGRNIGMRNVFFSRGKAKPECEGAKTVCEEAKQDREGVKPNREGEGAGKAEESGGANARGAEEKTLWDDWCTTLEEVHQLLCE